MGRITSYVTKSLVVVFLSLIVVFGGMPKDFLSEVAEALTCDTTPTVGDCPVGNVTNSITGRYRSLSVGIGMENGGHQTTDTVSLTVPTCSGGPATIYSAVLVWVNRDQDSTLTPPVTADYDNAVTIANDVPTVLNVTADREYVSDSASASGGGSSRYFYTTMSEDLPTSFIISDGASHDYTISNFDFDDGDGGNHLNFGFGLNVIYECPEYSFSTIYSEEGMDVANYTWAESWALNYTELVCTSFTAEAVSRSVDIQLQLAGADGPGRQADLWYTTGTGAAPDTATTDIVGSGTLLQADIMGAQQEEEWDIYDSLGGFTSTPAVTTKTAITLPATHTYACIQIDASDNTGGCPANCHASMALVSSAFILEEVRADLSAAKTVDGNNDTTFSASETVTPGVNFSWRLSVTNNGPNNATGVVATDTLPAGVTYVSDTGGGAYNSGTGVWTIGSLANGATATIDVVAVVQLADVATFNGGDGTNVLEITAANETDIDSTPNNGVTTEDDYATASVGAYTLSIGNLVWEDANNDGLNNNSEAPISGVRVELYSDDNANGSFDSGTDTLVSQSGTGGGAGFALTDGSGNWSFSGLNAGEYIAVIPCTTQFSSGGALSGYVSSTGGYGATGTYQPAPDPDGNINDDDNGSSSGGCPVASSAISLNYNSEPTDDGDSDNNTNLSVDFGFFRPASLGDYVWIDTNKNGLQDSGETAVQGVTVELYLDVDADGVAEPGADDGSAVAQLTTDSSGFYQFTNLAAGKYFVKFSNLPADYVFTSSGETDDTLNSDAESGGVTRVYDLSYGQALGTVDGGIHVDDSLAVTGVAALVSCIAGVSLILGSTTLSVPFKRSKAYRFYS